MRLGGHAAEPDVRALRPVGAAKRPLGHDEAYPNAQRHLGDLPLLDCSWLTRYSSING